ncbi:MAG: GNAT family N-acetyltransferase [Actinomycetota bacterium]
MITIREVGHADHAALLELNNAAVPAVNPHDAESLAELFAICDKAWVAVDEAGSIGGLLVTMAPGAPYGSRNFGWLEERFDDHGYVDRIIAARTHRRMGIAGKLYATFAEHATAAGRPRLTCEVNVEPPNPQSIAFHEANGWIAVADVEHEPGYVVRFFQKPL